MRFPRKSQGLRSGQVGEPEGVRKGRWRPGLEAPSPRYPPSTGRSSKAKTTEEAGACGAGPGGMGRVGQGGRPVSTLVRGWDGVGVVGWGTSDRSVCLSEGLPASRARAQSFHSFLMVRFHSQDRWSVLSSSVNRDLML